MSRVAANRELSRRHQFDFTDALNGALRLGVEGAERFDFIVKQIDAEGHRATHGKHVQQRTADCHFAVLENSLYGAVTIESKGFGKGLWIKGIPYL